MKREREKQRKIIKDTKINNKVYKNHNMFIADKRVCYWCV